MARIYGSDFRKKLEEEEKKKQQTASSVVSPKKSSSKKTSSSSFTKNKASAKKASALKEPASLRAGLSSSKQEATPKVSIKRHDFNSTDQKEKDQKEKDRKAGLNTWLFRDDLNQANKRFAAKNNSGEKEDAGKTIKKTDKKSDKKADVGDYTKAAGRGLSTGLKSFARGTARTFGMGAAETLENMDKSTTELMSEHASELSDFLSSGDSEKMKRKQGADRTSLADPTLYSPEWDKIVPGIVTIASKAGQVFTDFFSGLNGRRAIENSILQDVFTDEEAQKRGYANRQEFIEAEQQRALDESDVFRRDIEGYNTWLNQQPSSVQTVGNVGQAVGNMVPSIAAGAVTRSPSLAMGFMGTSAGGNSASAAYDAGAELDDALAYGVTSGLLEAGTERMFGGLPGLGKGVLDDAIKSATKKIGSRSGTNAITKTAKNVANRISQNKPVMTIARNAGAITGESAEEVVASFLDPFLQRGTFDPDAPLSTNESLLESAIVGGLTAAVLRGGVSAPRTVANAVNSRVESRQNRIADLRQKVDAVNSLVSTIPVRFRPDPLQFNTHLTQEDLDRYNNTVQDALGRYRSSVARRDYSHVRIGDNREVASNLAGLYNRLAQEERQLQDIYGTRNLTDKQKQEARAKYGIDTDLIQKEIDYDENYLADRILLYDEIDTESMVKRFGDEAMQALDFDSSLGDRQAQQAVLTGLSSSINRQDLADGVNRLYSDFVLSPDANYQTLKQGADSLAASLVPLDDAARADLYGDAIDISRDYSDLLKQMRNYRILVRDGDYDPNSYGDFRKQNFGSLVLSRKAGTPVDTVFQNLAEEYPEFFDAEQTTSAQDQLNRISEVLHEIRNSRRIRAEQESTFEADAALLSQQIQNMVLEQMRAKTGRAAENMTQDQEAEMQHGLMQQSYRRFADQMSFLDAAAQMSPEDRLRRAISDGTAENFYSRSAINRFLQMEADKANTEIIHYNGDDHYVSELIDELKARYPEDSDEFIMEQVEYVKQQIRNAEDPDVQNFLQSANETLSPYGVHVSLMPKVQRAANIEGYYDPSTKTIYIHPDVQSYGVASYIASHELVHHAIAQNPNLLRELKIMAQTAGIDLDSLRGNISRSYRSVYGDSALDRADEEALAVAISRIMQDDSLMNYVDEARPMALERIRDTLAERLNFSKRDRVTRKNQREMIRRITATLKGEPWDSIQIEQDRPEDSDTRPRFSGSTLNDDNIRYSITPVDDYGQPLSPEQREFFSESKATDAEGDLKRVYHGTMRGEFFEFSKSYASPSGDMGGGYYFTDSEADVWKNYANEEGPDIAYRIENLADQLYDTGEYSSYDDAYEAARAEYIRTEDPIVLEAYLNMKNPVELGGENPTRLDWRYDYDEETDSFGQARGSLVEFLENVSNVLEDYDPDSYTRQALYRAAEDYADMGGGLAADIIRDVKQALVYVDDPVTGESAGPEIVRQALEDMGYDGIIDHDVNRKFMGMGLTPGTNHYIIFNSNQAKLTDNLNPTDSPDIRYSVTLDFDAMREDVLKKWEEKQTEYGTKDPGMEPRVEERANQVPEQVDEDTRVSDFMRSVYEAPSTREEWITPLQIKILSGEGSYRRISDKEAETQANRAIRKKGVNKAYTDWISKSNDAQQTMTKQDLVLGEKLLVQAAEDGDMARWETLVGKLCAEATRAGQNLQAFALLKKLSPAGRLAATENYIDKLEDELSNKTKKDLNFDIPQEMKDAMKNAKSVEEIDAAEEAMIKYVAEQIPPSITDRVTAWRYLAMLGNPRTHIRNIVSNMAMAIERSAKDILGAGIESVASLATGGKIGRTKTLKPASKEVRAFSKQDFQVMKDSLRMGGHNGYDALIDRYRRSFGNTVFGKALEKLSKINSGALDLEDVAFMSLAYQSAMNQYLTANNVTVEELTAGTKEGNTKLANARAYATKEALKATYREANTLASVLNRLEQHNTFSRLIIGGMFPFKKTPINILKRGLEYSPLGLLEGITVETGRLAKGDISAAEYIDRLSSGLVGSGAFALGMYMAMQGIMKAGGDDDQKEEYYSQMLGEQPYSVNIGGRNYTIDWLTPTSMPLLAGVEYQLAQIAAEEGSDDDIEEDGETRLNRALEALLTTADPLTELSVLQGFNDAISGFGDNRLSGAIADVAGSFASQFIPTLSGQISRTIDPIRRTTYAPADSSYPGGKAVEQFVNSLENKSLINTLLIAQGSREANEPYIDMWGREEVRPDNILLRALEQSAAPWYAKSKNITPVDDKLTQLYEVSKNSSILPSTPRSNVSIDGTTYRLKPSEYTDYKRTVGQLSYTGLEDLFDQPGFDDLPQEDKEKLIDKVYEYANETAKTDFAESRNVMYEPKSMLGEINGFADLGFSIGQYMMMDSQLSSFHSDYDANGKTITSKKEKVLGYVNTLDLTPEQRAFILYDIMGYSPRTTR